RQASDVRCGIARRGSPQLVEHLVVVEVLDVFAHGRRDTWIGLLPGLPQLGVVVDFYLRRGLVGPDVPVAHLALVVERYDLGYFGRGVDFQRASLSLNG